MDKGTENIIRNIGAVALLFCILTFVFSGTMLRAQFQEIKNAENKYIESHSKTSENIDALRKVMNR